MESSKVKKGLRKRKYLSAGVRTDCHNIVKRFGKLKTLRYDTFAELWRHLKFSYIYYGRGCLEELVEFTEEVLRIAKEMWLKSETLNEQAGGLYTLYGLYLKQPTTGWVKVRLTPHDYELMENFHGKVKSGDHYDANYVLARMHMIGAFRFCVSEYTYGLDRCSRRYHEKDDSLHEVEEEPFYVKHLNTDIFSRLDAAFKVYHESKCKLASKNSNKPPQVLDYLDHKFSQSLNEEFQEILQIDDASKSQAECDNGKSKSNDKTDKTCAVGKSSKSPWWMLPVRNRIHRESSSESDPDDVAESTGQSIEKGNFSGKNSKEMLNAELGMSGDEVDEEDEEVDVEDDDEDDYSNVNSQELFTSEPGCSHDMPLLF